MTWTRRAVDQPNISMPMAASSAPSMRGAESDKIVGADWSCSSQREVHAVREVAVAQERSRAAPRRRLEQHSGQQHEHGDRAGRRLAHQRTAAPRPRGLRQLAQHDLHGKLQADRGADQDEAAYHVVEGEIVLHDRSADFGPAVGRLRDRPDLRHRPAHHQTDKAAEDHFGDLVQPCSTPISLEWR